MTTIPGLGRERNPSLSDLLVVFSARNGRTRNMTIDELKDILAPYIDASYWHHGIGAPVPSLGLNGDFYLNEAGAGGIFFKEADVWHGPFMQGVALDVVTDAATARTLGVGDSNTYIRFTNASSVTVTVPTDAMEAVKIGTVIEIYRASNGALSIVPFDGSVTINGSPLSISPFSTGRLKKVSANAWDFGVVVLDEVQYIPSLTVTVGSGEEYETWDEMYAAVRVMAGGELTINSSGPQDNAQRLYDFSNWTKIIVTTGVNFTTYAIVDAPVGSTFAGSAIGPYLFLQNFTFIGTVPVTASYFAWIDCNNGYSSLVSVTASAFVMNGVSGVSGVVAQNITSSCEIQTAGDVTLIDVTAPKITCGGGSLQILASTNNSATLVANFITARNGGSITVNSVDCGANGITNVFTVDQGTIYAPTSVTGTYTNLYNQNPGSRTEKGVINTSDSSKGTLSTIAGQNLTLLQQSSAQANLASRMTYADIHALTITDYPEGFRIFDMTWGVMVERRGTRWAPIGPFFVGGGTTNDNLSGTTTPTTLRSYGFPSKYIGPLGQLRLWRTAFSGASTNSKTLALRVASTTVATDGVAIGANVFSSATLIYAGQERFLQANGATNAQASSPSTAMVMGYSAGTVQPITTTIDMEAQDLLYLNVVGTLASGAGGVENVTHERLFLWINPGFVP